MSEMLNLNQQLERNLKFTEANLMARWHQSRQRLINRTEKLAQQDGRLTEMKDLISEIVDCVFKDMEGFFFDHEVQQKIEKNQPITALDLDNEWNQSVLLSYWSQKKLKRFNQLKKLHLLQEAQKY